MAGTVGGIGDWLTRHAHAHPDREALVYGDTRLTSSQLDERVRRLADALAARGVRQGDRVAALMLNSNAFIETLFACARLGAIFVPINFRLSPAEIRYVLDDAGAHLVVYHDLFADLLAPAREGTELLHAIRVNEGAAAVAASDEDYETVLAAGDPERPAAPVVQDDVHLMMYTSGTTGRPKGAMLTHGNSTWNAFNLLLHGSALGTGDTVLTVAPMFHIGGLNVHTLPAIYKGTRVVLAARFDPAATLERVQRERVTTLFLVPAMWLAISRVPDFDEYDLSSLHTLLSGGAPCPIPVIEFFQGRGLRFQEGFGMTETAPNASILDNADAVRKHGSVGKPLMHMEMRIVDESDRDVAEGETGELLVRGPNVFAGYWNRPEATREAFRGGWFHTGDLARRDDEGFYYIVDRKKDMLISGGENVYPTEVEQVLFRHPAVQEVAVVGIPDEKWGEVPMAIIVPREAGASLTLEDVQDFCAGKLARFKIPRKVEMVEQLPRNAAGKVLKRELRSRFAPSEK
ncbi:MAG TPA: long-chain fatty acid--CoA ligase [Gammaproteobacteria bacterium]|nr:long-chain fatty acid--CoA ligase [Gammaproteobacteria bacterium]